ncbi:uncharacterized protein ACA1_108250 [Acanthamoeba castellanii str. Neff]|uniref:Transmembrane protein n=1 Tax=Acanthamoeba castellanii (strain ATCC 30010 / Neff) TaxID=1257118 RepID=L8GDJ0_ACACF|nr:uncharacterized protein ACA1_108250 [Acanthamoeba castellanii str. Neff]ELR10788.1 hypothetical protein ACA1_108250 [Acanthamoeba castellanii str. Neff]
MDLDEPLDEDEQAEMIQTMERQNSQQDIFFRDTHVLNALLPQQQNAFFLVSLVFSLLKLYCALSQLFLPWQLPFHFYLDEVYPVWVVALLEFVSLLPFVLVGLYIRPRRAEVGTSSGSSPTEEESFHGRVIHKRQLLQWALLLHVPTLAVLLVTYLFTLPESPVSVLHFMWFVGASFAYLGLCKYLDGAMLEVEHGVRNLYNYTYSYKKA